MRDPRETIGEALRARAGGSVRAFAQVITADPSGAVLCWGELADHFDRLLADDSARLEAFEGLRAAADLSALVVFLDLNRARPGVLAAVWKVASELPATIQCALVSLDLSAELPADAAAKLHPAARALLADGPSRERDHQFYAAQAAALRAFRTRAPQVSEPAHSARTP
jgi:hypothetical protein